VRAAAADPVEWRVVDAKTDDAAGDAFDEWRRRVKKGRIG
jgi:hypothetical protein